MKTTKKTLIQIIKEELKQVVKEEADAHLRAQRRAAVRGGNPTMTPGIGKGEFTVRGGRVVWDPSIDSRLETSAARHAREKAVMRTMGEPSYQAKVTAAASARITPAIASLAAELGVHAIDSLAGPELKKLIAGLTGTSAEEIAKIPDPTLQQRLKKLVSPVTGLVDLAGMGVKELRLALTPERKLSGQEKGERISRQKIASEKEAEYAAKAAGAKGVRSPTSAEMIKHKLRPGTKMGRINENKTMKITKKQIEQIIREERQDILAEQATNPVGMPIEPDKRSMGVRDAEIMKVQQMRDAARAEREAKATERAAAAQELEKKKANDKSMEQAALSAMAELGAERALSQVEKALNNLSIIIEGATEGDDDSEQLGQDLLRRARSSDLSTRSGKIVDIKKYTRVGSKTSKSVTELARVLDQARIMLADTKNKLRGAKRVSSGDAPPR